MVGGGSFSEGYISQHFVTYKVKACLVAVVVTSVMMTCDQQWTANLPKCRTQVLHTKQIAHKTPEDCLPWAPSSLGNSAFLKA